MSVPTDKGSNAGAKVVALVAGMLAGADSIDDMNLLRHGGMGRLFHRTYAPSTLGSFLREFRFGHVRQLDALASRVLRALAADTPLLQVRTGERVMVDLDDTIIEVHGYQKQGAGFGYSGVRGLNTLLATAGDRDKPTICSVCRCDPIAAVNFPTRVSSVSRNRRDRTSVGERRALARSSDVRAR